MLWLCSQEVQLTSMDCHEKFEAVPVVFLHSRSGDAQCTGARSECKLLVASVPCWGALIQSLLV